MRVALNGISGAYQLAVTAGSTAKLKLRKLHVKLVVRTKPLSALPSILAAQYQSVQGMRLA